MSVIVEQGERCIYCEKAIESGHVCQGVVHSLLYRRRNAINDINQSKFEIAEIDRKLSELGVKLHNA